MKALGQRKALMILCTLMERREYSVIAPERMRLVLSQSALSQHLSRMREEGLVTFRRDAQTSYYRVTDPNVARVLSTLKSIYC